MIVLSLDPGGTTGAVAIEWDGVSVPPEPSSLIGHWQVPFEEMPVWLNGVLKLHDVRLLVMERFNISPRTVQYSRQPEALYTIGGAIFLCAINGVETRMQNASDAKNAYPNDRLKGWPVKGAHAKDALRHALLSCHRRVV